MQIVYVAEDLFLFSRFCLGGELEDFTFKKEENNTALSLVVKEDRDNLVEVRKQSLLIVSTLQYFILRKPHSLLNARRQYKVSCVQAAFLALLFPKLYLASYLTSLR